MERIRGEWLVWAAVAVGLLLRGYHYARLPAVWHDEAAMIVNVLELPPEGVLGPLLYDEASPPLFLLLEKATVAALGDSEYALRLPPFLAACGAVVLTAVVGRRLFSPVWAAVAVGLVAVSDRLLFHACEAKVYSFDVLLAVAAVYFVVATDRWPVWVRCLLGAVLAPVAIWLSFPGCFICGGVLVALLPAVGRADWRGRVAYLVFALSVGVAFLLLVRGPATAQRTGPMDACWTNGFPNWGNLPSVPGWAIGNWFDVVRYCFHPYGWPMLVLAGVGVWSLTRSRRGWPVAVSAGLPMVLVFVAACMGKYPFGPFRVVAFLTPGLALLAAEGLRRLWGWFWPRAGWRWALFLWVAVLLIPAGYTVRRVFDVWDRAECDRAAEYVLSHRAEGEPIHANHWEYDYYFRRLDPRFVRIAHRYNPGPGWVEWGEEWSEGTPPPRIWLIHHETPKPDRMPYPLPPGYRVASVREFNWVRVWELVPER